MTTNSMLVAVMLLCSSALAQAPDAGVLAPEATPSPSESPAPAETTSPAEAAAAVPSIDDRLVTLEGRLGSLDEQYAETKGSVLKLEKLKFSGYVQGRYQFAENSTSGTTGTAARVLDGFTVRRGRLKAAYTGSKASVVLQVDATGKGVSVKDAEATLTEPWTGKKLTLTVGQTKWPFGYEVGQSSGDREFPERTRVVRAFAPGERDRGAKLSYKEGIFRATVGVFDGNGTENKGPSSCSSCFTGLDNDTEKDVVGRVGVDLKWLAAGVSGWAGKTFNTTDLNKAGGYYARNRIGLDAQLYLDLVPLGGTAVKGELIAGTTYASSGVERPGQTALGWYGLVIQNFGLNDQLGVRFDFFDPYTGTPDGVSSSDPTVPRSTNSVSTLGLLYLHHFDETLKAAVVYELPITSGGATTARDPADNLFTVQLQAKF